MISFLLRLSVCVALLAGAPSFAAENVDATPLVIIRVKDTPVSYEHTVTRAVKRALEIKASSEFSIHMVAPEKSTKEALAKLSNAAGKLSDVLENAGVLKTQIHTENAVGERPELQLFVK